MPIIKTRQWRCTWPPNWKVMICGFILDSNFEVLFSFVQFCSVSMAAVVAPFRARRLFGAKSDALYTPWEFPKRVTLKGLLEKALESTRKMTVEKYELHLIASCLFDKHMMQQVRPSSNLRSTSRSIILFGSIFKLITCCGQSNAAG